MVAVGASTPSGEWATFSNYGPTVALAAPGINVVGTTRTDLGLAQPYGRAEAGTSFSTPLVSGMFALMIARNPSLGAEEYIRIARDAATSATPAPHGQNWAGAGIINIGAAVARTPMTVSGSALRDWKDVSNGTEVRAQVAGVDCGVTKVAAFGPLARFSLRVQADAEHPGCGAPGRTVQLLVGGFAATPTFAWGGKDEDLALLGRDVSSVSPPPGPIVIQTLNGPWSNIAQLDSSSPLPSALLGLGSPWSEVLRWDPAKPVFDDPGGFLRYAKNVPPFVNDLPGLNQYDAFWVDGGSATAAAPNPNPPAGRTVELKPGWNNLVYTGTTRQVAEALLTIEGKYTQLLQFDNAGQRWTSYLPGRPRYLNDFGAVFRLKVYWVYMTDSATLTMN